MINIEENNVVEYYYINLIKEEEMIDEAIIAIYDSIQRFKETNASEDSIERLISTIELLETKKENIKRSLR